MNKIWTFFVICSCIALVFTDPSIMISEMTTATSDVLRLCAELLAIYTVWMGILEIVDQTGLGNKLAKLLSPLIKWLFKIDDAETEKYIALNMSSNMLGLGNASTPMGIKAMQRLDDKSGKITPPMIMLLIVNATSIQLLPTTVVGLRATAGSVNPSDIILPTFFATLITCVVAVFATKLCQRLASKKKAVKK